MAISRKPRPTSTPTFDVEALINKGGTPPASVEDKPEESVAVVLRLPKEMNSHIMDCLKARPVRTPRHTWLLEAVHEKLVRELQSND